MNWLNIFFVIFIVTAVHVNAVQNDDNQAADKAENVCPLKIGDEVPSVNVRDTKGNELAINELVKENKTIIIFYRGGWCPYCNLHLSELQKVESEIVQLGYKLIAISMDKPEKLNKSIEEHEFNYELYSDSKAEASKAFGIAFKVEDSYVNKLKDYDIDLEESSGETHHILPVPSVFITDEAGVIKFQYVNPNYKVRISGDLLLAAAKANK